MENTQPYETLDPENWNEMRALAHRMVDDAISYLETVRDRPVWQSVPEEVAERFKEQAPYEPEGADSVYEEFVEKSSLIPWAPSIRAFGAGTWAMGPSSARSQISWLRP
ncbi:MAG TPA: hypothetical protein VJ785_09600 [Anaerolineales bacterium]|nr:hypothetical protein [Anaerolineales bacterium]